MRNSLQTFTLSFLTLIAFMAAQANEGSEEEFYILPDFVVTDEDDKGYYSANTLAGTRTNELTKNIPMTISTVNAEMIEDFKMKTLADLGNFVPSIEAEGSVYNNQEIRFRGLLTRNQLYEFMPRYSPLDWYNVGRSDIIRGANSLIYGQADPGGKVNVLSKTANFSKDRGSAVVEIGDKSWHKFTLDLNKVYGDKTAARFMFVDKHREFDANYKYQSFIGRTLEIEHRPQTNTRLRLHLEQGEAERSLIGGTFKVGSSPTGLPNGIVADPKLADLISDELLNEIANYSKVNAFDGVNHDSIYPASNAGLTNLYGFIDVNTDGRIGPNYTDWNGNNKYDYSDVFLLDTQSDSDAGNPNATLRDRFGDEILEETEDGWVPIQLVGVPDNMSFLTEEQYIQVFGGLPNIGSNNNGQPDPGENSYALIGRDNDGNLLPGIIDRAEIDPLIPGDIGGEPFVDSNDDQIYNDSDYASGINSGGGLMTRSDNPNIWGINPAGGPLVPDYIDNREDIRNLFRGIDYRNSGTGFGPDSYSIRKFDFILAEMDHEFSDKLSVNVKVGFEDLDSKTITSGWSANQLKFSSGYGRTVRFPNLRSLNNYKENPINNGIQSPYEAVLVDLTNANFAHEIVNTIEAKGIESIRSDFHAAINGVTADPANDIDKQDPRWGGSVNLVAFNNADADDNGSVTTTEMVDYFVDSFLKPYTTNGENLSNLEKWYEVAKFGGRVRNFLDQSHSNYESSYSYLWGNRANGKESLGEIFYDILTDGEQSVPNGKAVSEIYNLDRYVDVRKYREQLQNYDTPQDFIGRSSRLNSGNNAQLYSNGWSYENISLQNLNYSGLIDNPVSDTDENGNLVTIEIATKDYALLEDGEKLIYDAIPTWLIAGLNGQIRDMNTVRIVDEYGNITTPEISGIFPTFDSEGDEIPLTQRIDNKVNGADPDEVDLQRRAIAKHVYEKLITDLSDTSDEDLLDNQFWDATNKVYDFFKYELHETNDYSWMWRDYVQPGLLLRLDAVAEDTAYLDPNSEFIDMDGDGIRDNALPSISASTGEILEPYITRQWQRNTLSDNNKSARITYKYIEEEDFIPGSQEFLFGIDLDDREASQVNEYQISLNARAWPTANGLDVYLRREMLSDHVGLYDNIFQTEGGYANLDLNINGHQYDGAPNWITNTRIPYSVGNVARWQRLQAYEATVESNALWFAANGKYFNDRLRTLMGVRRDQISVNASSTRLMHRTLDPKVVQDLMEVKSEEVNKTIYCPSIGALYWFNKNISIFGNYSESVISPTGFQFDVFGDLTPPETGKGTEIGFKLSTSDNVLNGQLTVFTIDKKNEQRQNISWPMLTSLYPSKNADGSVIDPNQEYTDEAGNGIGHYPNEIYDYYNYVDRLGNPQIDPETGEPLIRTVFNPKGYRVADEEVRSEGIELDLYYNPNRNLSIFLGYAYLDTSVLKSSLSILEGLPTAGTSDHSANFTIKYSFKDGRFKGTQIGLNQKYRSSALLSHYFVDQDGDSQADYIPVLVDDPKTNGNSQILMQPKYNTLWLEDQFNTDLFFKWSGKIRKHMPWTVLQLNINNIFNNRSLISTGLNNARYQEGRNIVFSGGIYF